MRQFRYKVIWIEPDNLSEELNSLGNEGWELVAMVASQEERQEFNEYTNQWIELMDDGFKCVFKREVM